ncbi:TIGR03621 family F420-dependent LLM class oxidoreductase [Mycolicibacterium holsaticum]|uniref:TIGR03621 family F420-dependent LLM class oxidoreductase n=1 Tax=Mycolicibacterium holsaticum TaxID=152142 RepID=UPI001C7D55A7|nr:TIGR03621 family F420-dependent LLM class oxidoreductase [Mycolicibacterium holsaticum]MDA4106210.1 luciferase [Mycolicibacterium holsaticum DSM 44478 = JCM 12374]QZA13469.1 TIGR03621 family F420-dependent LLM class oxidoreductase [Mycolicibacterium holsaticum DSM 44478 = JCM 12374]UNC09066.1 TIGR03621 family F420-dependent LLM class oxidoreductase [Mycolicibacterium holsaticum DSM 44478 = JCM 12374]
MAKDFRFGVGLQAARRRQSVQDFARHVEDMGYDVLHMADHLYTTAPFPMLTAIAVATERLRVGTFVLNAGFYRPALLARDVTSLRDLSDGRFELGLGAGYVEEEFQQAELPFPTPGQRVSWLRHVTEHFNAHVPDVPILIAGNGDKLLTLAAQRADIIGLTGGAPVGPDSDPLADRVAFVRAAAGERFGELELNLAVTAMPTDDSGRPDMAITRQFLPGLSDDELLRTPAVLSGSTKEIADTLRGYRETYGVTYITVQQPHAEVFAKVIAELR